MPNTLQPIIPTSPLGNQLNKMVKHGNSNIVKNGGDVIVRRTLQGTELSLSGQIKYTLTDLTRYRGEYSATDGYDYNDIVRVKPNKTYIDVSISDTTVVPATPGVWICIKQVPDAYISRYFITQGASLDNINVRNPDKEYHPKWPEPTATEDLYWELLSLMPITRTVCDENNQPVTSYVDSHISGSEGG